MAVVRRALIGVIVGIFGVAAALGLSYPAGAKSAKKASRALRYGCRVESRARQARCEM